MERAILWTLLLCSLIVAGWSVIEVGRLRAALRDVYCDARDGITAERRFTYPIFRALGHQPENYGKDARNPLMTGKGRFRSHPMTAALRRSREATVSLLRYLRGATSRARSLRSNRSSVAGNIP